MSRHRVIEIRGEPGHQPHTLREIPQLHRFFRIVASVVVAHENHCRWHTGCGKSPASCPAPLVIIVEGTPAADVAEHDVARRPRQSDGRFLQHRPRPSWLDAFRRYGIPCGGENRGGEPARAARRRLTFGNSDAAQLCWRRSQCRCGCPSAWGSSNDRLVGWKRLTSASWFDGAYSSSTLFNAREGERLIF